jgi:hypothetical protein
MFKNTISLAVWVLLSGCAFMNQEQSLNKTLEAVSNSEQNITRQLEGLDATLNKQADYIGELKAKITALSNDVVLLKKRRMYDASAKIPTDITPTDITPNLNTSSNVVVADLDPQFRTGMVTLGSLENIYINLVKSVFVARVDTGATTSSINAVDMQNFERDGKKWIKFHVSDEQTAPIDRKWIEAPIVRYVKIRQSNTDDLERRPVIELWVKIGRVHEKSQFTLTDRTLMDYPILLGREFIQDVALVDVSRDFIESKAPKKPLKDPA